MSALYKCVFIDHHIITQVIKSELIVRSVSNIAVICRLLFFTRLPLQDKTRSKTKEFVNTPHFLASDSGKVIIDRDDMNALTLKRVQIRRHYRNKCLALAGLHFRDSSLMKQDSAKDLHIERSLAEHAVSRFTYKRICVGQDIVKRLTGRQSAPEGIRAFAHFGITHSRVFGRKCIDRL